MSKVINKKTVIAIALASITSAAMAPAAFAGNSYMGGGVGYSDFEDACSNSKTKDAGGCDDEDLGYNLFVGYQFNDYFAIEGGYFDLGKAEVNNDKFRTHGGTLSAISRLPLGERFSLFGELGAYGYHAETNNRTDNGISPMAGAGITYKMSNSFDLQARYRRTEQIGRDRNTGMNDNNYMGLELVYHIGRSPIVPIAAVVVEEVIPVVEPEPVVEAIVEPVMPVYVTKTAQDNETVLFGFDSANLDYQAKSTLDEAIRFVNQYENSSINLLARTDTQGHSDYNQKLSERRAMAVKQYLVSNGVSIEKISDTAIGEDGMVNHNKTSRANDRRVELTLTGNYQVEVTAKAN
ncbi:outer membrane beta-barrel protein [Vibrio sp. SS-MA-C1-2]|uniref:outer membrane beta-barrel protein n=1 Tax=Vibrio sp. SS-MA-C1-2 TaxID=2908646 RepID=UPI001F2AA79F|nr:outer membrane beta-barrel protein [Vibrio sp. SS-MA-C1-2]UJF18685.1 outer membrane beta-barrel protein [Vibrio sp. SS-MA-C1-2]